MTSLWGSRAILSALLLAPAAATAQTVPELGVIGAVTGSDPALVAVGAYGALRTSLRTRASIAGMLGASGGDAAWRAELLMHFLLSPTRERGVGAYGAGGIGVVGGPADQGYVVLTLGLESRPAAPSGWFLEAGVGGGARVAAGYRWRRFPAGWAGLDK
jgi:hypothetical protein